MKRYVHVLQSLGVAAAIFGFGKFHAAAVAVNTYDLTSDIRFPLLMAYWALVLLVSYTLGLPDLPRTRKARWFTGIAAAGASALAVSLVQLVIGEPLLPRFVVFATALVLPPWFAICSSLVDGGRSRAEQRDRVLIISDWVDRVELAQELDDAERPATLARVMSVAEAEGGPETTQSLVEVALELSASIVVLDREAQLSTRVVDQVAQLHTAGMRVRTYSLFYEQWFGKLPVAELERVSLMFDIGEIHRSRYGRLKRLIDLVVAIAVTPIFLLALPVVLIGNLVGNRGPLFFRQTRVGHLGRDITLFKFRSMRYDEDDDQSWTTANDPRVTSFGRFLRTSHLDELPQLINVFRNELSLVGPRPEQRRYVDELEGKLPFYELRHLVRPGLTGWAQVKSGYSDDEAGALEKLQFEFFYMRRQSLLFDVQILIRTLRSVVLGDGR